MWALILSLKILGCVVLALMLLLVLVLFWPAAYRIRGAFSEEKKSIDACLFLLGHLLFLQVSYEEELGVFLRIFGKGIDLLHRKKKKKTKTKKKKKQEAAPTPLYKKVAGVGRLIALIFEYDLLQALWPALAKFLKRLSPRRLDGELTFSLGDPARMGEVLGLVAVLPCFLESELSLTPDFEAEEGYVLGAIASSGRVKIVWIVAMLLSWIKNPTIRMFLKKRKG